MAMANSWKKARRRAGAALVLAVALLGNTVLAAPFAHADNKHKRINQNHNRGIVPRTETTINKTTDFEIGKRLLTPARREIGRIHEEKGMRGVALSLRQNAPVWTTRRTVTLLIPSIRAPIPPERRCPATAESEREVHPETLAR